MNRSVTYSCKRIVNEHLVRARIPRPLLYVEVRDRSELKVVVGGATRTGRRLQSSPGSITIISDPGFANMNDPICKVGNEPRLQGNEVKCIPCGIGHYGTNASCQLCPVGRYSQLGREHIFVSVRKSNESVSDETRSDVRPIKSFLDNWMCVVIRRVVFRPFQMF